MLLSGSSSGVELLPSKQVVAGSNPVSRSTEENANQEVNVGNEATPDTGSGNIGARFGVDGRLCCLSVWP